LKKDKLLNIERSIKLSFPTVNRHVC
jgi:hypothetical protein